MDYWIWRIAVVALVLTMNWCLECHKKTDVNTESNAYYTKIHEELAKKYGVDKFTVRDMVGLECGKCHY